MEKREALDDEVGYDTDADLVSVYLLARIRKQKPEWFEEPSLPIIRKKRRKKLNLKGRFNYISTRSNDSSWEDNLPDFVAFEKSTRVYQ